MEALEAGVAVAGTDFCDQTHELAQTDMFYPLAAQRPEAVADLLVQLSSEWCERGQLARQGEGPTWKVLRDSYSLERTTEELLAWVSAPSRSPGGVAIDFLEDYWQELARLQERLEAVWNSPTWRYLGRVHRLFSRLSGR